MTRRRDIEVSRVVRLPLAKTRHSLRHSTLAAVTARATKRSASLKTDAGKSMQSVPGAKSGHADVQRQLTSAEAKIRELEIRLAAVTDRIAWIADRLHSLLEARE